MATKKYLSLDRLTEYDALLKEKIDTELSDKQDILTGSEGQFVQFDASGKPVAIDPVFITVDDVDTICGSTIEFVDTEGATF